MKAYWSTWSMALYLIMGFISMSAVKKTKRIESITGQKQPVSNNSYIVWYLIWLFITVFRKVDFGIGGSDAIQYKLYFDDCLNPNLHTLYAEHLDYGFQILTKIIRSFTSNYKIYFALIYSIIIVSYIVFINELTPTRIYYEPMVLAFFVYLRGFTSIRTNLSVAFLLLSLVYFYKSKKILSGAFLILCLGMHIASFLFVPFYVFYFLYKKKNRLKIWQWVSLYLLVLIGARVGQQVVMRMTGLRGAYAYYASVSMNASFFDNGWKIAFGQILLLVLFFCFQFDVYKMIEKCEVVDKNRYRFVYLICVYDFLMIPVNFILGIWRGSEYFYLARLILWGVVIKTISAHISVNSKKIFRISVLILFVAWMVFRVYNTYEDSLLMPYIFDII
jgi:hypothetical protein